MGSEPAGLEEYEREVIVRLMEEGYVGRKYAPIERVASVINWNELANRYGVGRGFKSVLRSLKAKGLVTDHGKSLQVVSLTKEGFRLALALKGE